MMSNTGLLEIQTFPSVNMRFKSCTLFSVTRESDLQLNLPPALQLKTGNVRQTILRRKRGKACATPLMLRKRLFILPPKSQTFGTRR